MRLIEIGEAVGALEPALLAQEPEIPWADIKAMRNHLAHRYFDTAHAIVADTVTRELPPLIEAVLRLLDAHDAGPDSDSE
ncbi:HepT-like ribonuclease domain-containing protein [Sporichthya brevicatena]|uniref:HepT-like ribonuclease domain-containing protein n=1 Tax=Sporichthya brevicatena TaxID=171442 RepID=UPI0031D77D16